jgi:hypothetical protein
MFIIGDRVEVTRRWHKGERKGTVVEVRADEVLVELDPIYYCRQSEAQLANDEARDVEYPGWRQFRYWHWQVTKLEVSEDGV